MKPVLKVIYYVTQTKKPMIVRHPEILLTKTKIELNKEFQKTFIKDTNDRYFIKILQDERDKADFYIVITTEPIHQSYEIHYSKNTIWFGNAELVNYIKMSTGFTDDKVKFRVSIFSDNEIKSDIDKEVYPIITKVNLFKSKSRKS